MTDHPTAKIAKEVLDLACERYPGLAFTVLVVDGEGVACCSQYTDRGLKKLLLGYADLLTTDLLTTDTLDD